MNRQTELRKAIVGASLPPRDRAIYAVLAERAEWATGEILPRWQPRGLEDLARLCSLPKSVVAVGLNHLELHKWIERDRSPGGPGRTTRYRLGIGAACDCRPARGEPVSEAERSRRYRARRKLSGIRVTLTTLEASGSAVTQPPVTVRIPRDARGAQLSGIHVTNCPAVSDDFPGQSHFSAKDTRTRKELTSTSDYLVGPADEDASRDARKWPPGSNGEAA